MRDATMDRGLFKESSKAGGLLLSAFRAGKTDAITWVDVPVGDLIVTVAADAVKGPLGDRTGVRLPVCYEEAVEICRELGCVMPTQAICDAMYAQAKGRLNYVPLVKTPADTAKMCDCEFVLKFNDKVEKQLGGLGCSPGGLVFGAWKLWILHPRIVERGAVNYGFWDIKTKKPVQTVGAKHDAKHYDYSQLLQPVKRMARDAATGEPVDLLDYLAKRAKIPGKYLICYRPAQRGPDREVPKGPIDLLEVLTAAGVRVKPAAGWQGRGKPGFTPEGILLHHTAGPKKGDAPSLKVCIEGRPDLSGPLCHIVLARSGEAHLIAAKKANHAGSGALQVLERVRADKAIEGDAKKNGWKDEGSGNAYFYGIEVENSGMPEDAYPEAQVDALVKICAALCRAHGWSANRVVHHRQWTARKVDMSYKGDLVGAVREVMSAMGGGERALPLAPGRSRSVKKAPPKKRAAGEKGRGKGAAKAAPAGRAKPTKTGASAKKKAARDGDLKPATPTGRRKNQKAALAR
jgi:hypothetical protein